MNDPLMIGGLTRPELCERISHLTELLLGADRELECCRSDINCPASITEDVLVWVSELEAARSEYLKAFDQLPPL